MKQLKPKKYLLLAIAALSSSAAYAWELGDVFAGMSTNVTTPGSYHDQAAGYYSGGGFSMRMKHNNVCNPIAITPPSYKIGCSGTDMYMGSLSVISGEQFVQVAKNIGTQAASYGFQLALKTFAPQIENLLSKLRDQLMELNQFAVEDCQAVQSMYASMLSKDSAMYENVCKDLAQQGGGKDYFKARETCQNQDEARRKARENQVLTNEEELTGDYNLFMIAAKKANIPEEFRVAMMAITGTLVMKDGKRTPRPSLVDDISWGPYLKGGNASVYVCQDGSECLIVGKTTKNISLEQSYQGKASAKLAQIKHGMIENQPFAPENKAFLSSIGDTFPIYDYLSLEVVSGINIMDKASELVATYMIVQYLNGIVREVRHAALVMEAKQINDQHIKDYLKQLDQTQAFISKKYQNLMAVAFNLEKSAKFLEAHQVARAR